MKEDGTLVYRFNISIKPNHHFPHKYAHWNNDKNAGLKYKWGFIGDLNFTDNYGQNVNTRVSNYDKWFSEKIQHILTDETNNSDINWFKPFYIQYRSFQVVNDSPFTNKKLCDAEKLRGHNDIRSHTSSCGMSFNNAQLSYFSKVGNNNWLNYCLKEKSKSSRWLEDNHGWKGCTSNGEVWNKDEGRCMPLVPFCSQVDKTQKICLGCEIGYERFVELDGLFKPKRWYLSKDQMSAWEKSFTMGKSKCKPCKGKYLYNSFTRECHKAVKDISINYKTTNKGRYHYFQGMKVPKFPQNKANKGMALMWFELKLATKVPIDNIPVVETQVYYRTPSKRGKCLETKKGQKFQSVYDIDATGKKIYKDYNRAFFDLEKYHKSKDGGRHYYMSWYHAVPMGKEIQTKITLYGHDRDESKYFVKSFKYRFDNKQADGKWDYYTKQKSAVDLKKLYFYNKDKVIKTVAKTNWDTDYDFTMVELGRGKRIADDLVYMNIDFNIEMTAVQTWVKLDKYHFRRDADVPLMTVRFEGRPKEGSDYAKPFEYTLYGNPNKNQLSFKKKKRQKGDELKDIKFEKWQFVGLAMKYQVMSSGTKVCFYYLSTTEYLPFNQNDIYCEHAYKLDLGKQISAIMAAKRYSRNRPKSWVTGMYYGATLAHQVLIQDHYAERAIFLNFITNNLDYKSQIRNYARIDQKANGNWVTEANNGTYKFIYSNQDIEKGYYVQVFSKPRNVWNEMGPLKNTYYISGYVEMVDNFYMFDIDNADETWSADYPIYRMIARDGKELVNFSHHIDYDDQAVYVRNDNRGIGGRKMVSSVNTNFMFIHPKDGRSDYTFDMRKFKSWKVQITDYESKKAMFGFNVAFRTLPKFWRKSNNKKFNHILSLRHSWGVYQDIPLYYNNFYDDIRNRHLIGHHRDGMDENIKPILHKFVSFAMTYGPLKYGEMTAKEKRDSSIGANGLSFVTKVKPATYSTCYSYNDPYALFSKKNPFKQNISFEDNWASGFTTGPSVMCQHGFILMNFDKVATCVKPPPNLVLYKKKMKPETYYPSAHKGKLRSYMKNFRHGWDPFTHNKHNPKIAFKHYAQYKKYSVLKNIVKASNLCYKDFLGQCINCPKGYFFSKGENKNTYQKRPPFRYVTTHTASGCHKCLKNKPNCLACDKIGCTLCREGYFLNQKGTCVKCGRNQVFDTFTKKCFHAKANPYVEIHHDKSLPKITTSGVYGYSQNRTAIIELELEYMREERQKKLKRTKFGSRVRAEKLSIKVEIIAPSYTRNMTIADIPTSFKRSISFRTTLPANENIKFITHINTEEKAHYLYYSLMRVKYTLVKMQKEGEMDIHLGPDADSNKAVSAKEVARFSRGIAVKEIDEFETLYEFYMGK